ncbi:MAG TPA: hypothetical protein VH413_13320 [Verrucomicrobiae bacterium]|jgi:hypothetical protein|nr:hypothetical protein [Verrucomicrobiae bacterium]
MLVFTTRVWLVFLVDAAYRAGLNPLSKRRVHRLVFLSNCLAPLFQATPNTAQIVKYKHGPFYPLIQWELDRLATMGVLTIDNLKYTNDEKGWWVSADYGAGQMMNPVLTHCRQSAYGQRLGDYLNEVVAGFASLRGAALDEVALRDENYNQPGATADSFIDFSEQEENFSLRTARAFRDVLPANLVPTQKEELFLYMRFLEALVAKKTN